MTPKAQATKQKIEKRRKTFYAEEMQIIYADTPLKRKGA